MWRIGSRCAQGNSLRHRLIHAPLVMETNKPSDAGGDGRFSGVDRLPRPLNMGEFTLAVREHCPEDLAVSGARGAVLLSIDVDEVGAVISSRAVEPPALEGIQVSAILVDGVTGQRREVAPARGAHPALRKAAEEAAHMLRFAPAERAGQPVAFRDYRVTVEVAPPHLP